MRACDSRQSIADCGVVTRGREVVFGVVEIFPAVVRDEGVGARGSFLEDVDSRGVVEVAENLMHGAAALIRRQWLTAQGVPLPDSTLRYRPRRFTATAISSA